MEKAQTTAIILNWNNLNVSRDSIRRLRREVPIIVVDNGSNDGSQLYFADKLKKDEYIQMGYNAGNCVARNFGIQRVKTKYFFLLDGDILYVPNSIKVLETILDKYDTCGCVGVNNNESIHKYGFNGTPNLDEASIKAEPSPIFKGFPMAWTQYGLFRNTGQKFPDFDPFDTAGIGYEDDWYYHEMKESGLESFFIQYPLYFHDAHAGKRELNKAKADMREEERKKAFNDKWGSNWQEKEMQIELV
jgi:glycosyltransferase involved in cell wall biosynthesis